MGNCCNGQQINNEISKNQLEDEIPPIDINQYLHEEKVVYGEKDSKLEIEEIDCKQKAPSLISFEVLSKNAQDTLKKFKNYDVRYSKKETQEEDNELIELEEKILENKTIYKGQWKNGKRHGKGELFWRDGSYYQGQWKNDKIEGKGKVIYANGDMYIGNWHQDKAQGFGIFLHFDGSKYEG